MMISTKGRYALRFMIDVAQFGTEGVVTLKASAERQGISVKYLEQIATPLMRAGLIRSIRGNQGGYVLTRDPAQYTAGEILRVMEGSLSPIACLQNDDNLCERRDTCSTIHFWEGLYKVVREYTDSVSLADLANVSCTETLTAKEGIG